MKTMIKIAIVTLLGMSSVFAQTTGQNKKAAKLAAVKSMVENKHYTFVAEYMNPLRGGTKILTSEYLFKVNKDSAYSFLPYFGQAYFDVPYNPTDGGVKFTSTNFDYKVKNKKKGGWQITILPKDVKYTDKLFLDVSVDGYASLSVNSTNRDEISFNGYLR